jgi:hypothetical protein
MTPFELWLAVLVPGNVVAWGAFVWKLRHRR